MSLSIERFDEFFRAVWGYAPFPWQARLAEQVFNEGWPECIDLPTASGKTAAIDIAVFVLACQANLETKDRTVGRRVFFTVNRRVIVDEAFDRSFKLAGKLLQAEGGILKNVADALREISGDPQAPPLDVAQLRGGVYRDRAWARSITQPLVVCTTADQLGSRLLFRGYGVSSASAPIHAALCGCDSLVLLDEAHVTRAFSQTMQLIMRYQAQHSTAPTMRFVQLTATPFSAKNRFELDARDRSDPILKARQEVSKPAALAKLAKKKPIAGEIVRRAFDALSDSRRAVGIIVNRVQTAREIERLLQEEVEKRHDQDESFQAEVHLVIGRMRPYDRDRLQGELGRLIGADRDREKEPLRKPVFVVATQCLEVGADYDFDALITECASIDALRQRFGRLNRKGRSIEAMAAIVATDDSVRGGDAVYGDAIKHTWEWLTKGGRESIDFGINKFKELWNEIEEPEPLLAPAPDAAVLLPAHLDALCQTSPPPVPSPDVSYFIHGPNRDNAEVNVCWRSDLGEDEMRWEEVVGMLPPLSYECMTVPLHEVRGWMRGHEPPADADVGVAAQDDALPRNSHHGAARTVVVYRGTNEIVLASDPAALRPGDVIVISTTLDPPPTFGHIPLNDGKLLLDVAEKAYKISRRIRVVRVHESVHPELPAELKAYAVAAGAVELRKSQLRELLGELGSGFSSGPDEVAYPPDVVGNPTGMLLRFNSLLPIRSLLSHVDRLEDDGVDSSLESSCVVTLETHGKNVQERSINSCDLLHVQRLRAMFATAGDCHDLGKADVRFNAMLGGLTPFEAFGRQLLAKSGLRLLSKAESDARRKRASLPAGFRHEMLSVQIVEHNLQELLDESRDRDLLLHVIAAHHGYARPFAPVVLDDAADETISITVNGISISPDERKSWTCSHRLDSGVAERFWKLTREHGWWGLAWLESILRLADQQASAAEQEGYGR